MSSAPRNPSPRSPLASLIFASRWLQLPLYLGLILAQCVYVFLFGKELWHLIHDAGSMGEQQIMLIVLGLIDVVMAASQIGQSTCSILTSEGVLWQTIIHCVFILSAIGIAWADRLMHPATGHGKAH